MKAIIANFARQDELDKAAAAAAVPHAAAAALALEGGGAEGEEDEEEAARSLGISVSLSLWRSEKRDSVKGERVQAEAIPGTRKKVIKRATKEYNTRAMMNQ